MGVIKRNKLFKISPKLSEHLQSIRRNKREEVVDLLIRPLRMGHTLLTHSSSFKQEERPICVACDEGLAVKHIVFGRADLIEIRHKHFTAEIMERLFRDVPPDMIFNFFKEINVFRWI